MRVPDEHRYERDDEERRVDVGDKVRFRVGVISKDGLLIRLVQFTDWRMLRLRTLARKLDAVHCTTVTSSRMMPNVCLHRLRLALSSFIHVFPALLTVLPERLSSSALGARDVWSSALVPKAIMAV